MSEFLLSKVKTISSLYSAINRDYILSKTSLNNGKSNIISNSLFYEYFNNCIDEDLEDEVIMFESYRISVLLCLKTRFTFTAPLVCLLKTKCIGKEGSLALTSDDISLFSEDYIYLCSFIGCIFNDESMENMIHYNPHHFYGFLIQKLCGIAETDVLKVFNCIRDNFDNNKYSENLLKAMVLACIFNISNEKHKHLLVKIYCDMYENFNINIVYDHRSYLDSLGYDFPFRKNELNNILKSQKSSLYTIYNETFLWNSNYYFNSFSITWSRYYKLNISFVEELIDNLDYLTPMDIQHLRSGDIFSPTIRNLSKQFSIVQKTIETYIIDCKYVEREKDLSRVMEFLNTLYSFVRISLKLKTHKDVVDIIQSKCLYEFTMRIFKEILFHHSNKIYVNGMEKNKFIEELALTSINAQFILNSISNSRIDIDLNNS